MEKELKKAKFRLMTLADEGLFYRFASQTRNDLSAHTRFAFLSIYMPFVNVYIRETEHFLLIVLFDTVHKRLACLPPLGDWANYSLKRPMESYRSVFRALKADFVMIDVGEWMLPALQAAGLDTAHMQHDAEERDCVFMARDYALSLMREQTKQEIEKISASHALRWLDYSDEGKEMFLQAIKAVFDTRLKKLDAERLYAQLLDLLAPLDIRLSMLVSENNMLGLLAYRLIDSQMEILMYYAAARPKGVEAVMRQRICESMGAEARKIFIAGAYYDKSLVAGKQAELRSQQLFNYVIHG